MILATSITKSYLDKSKPFFDSAVKHFHGTRICFCIGFSCEIKGWETVNVPIESLQINWQPYNRNNYHSLQHGEFTRHYIFNPKEIIIFCDSDMVMQKDFYYYDIDNLSTFCVTDSSFPPTKIYNVIENLKCSYPDLVMRGYGIGYDETESCACFMIANIESWKLLYKRVYANKSFLKHFRHHAAWQLLISILIKATFDYEVLKPVICCADWYTGSPAKYVGDKLMIDGKEVYFNHTKFNNVSDNRV